MNSIFVNAGEVTLHALKAGDGTKPALILIHGYVASSEWWRGTMNDLCDTFTVYALDMRGCGLSDKMRDGYSVDQMAADVALFMEAQGIAQATIVGHSMGGFIAQSVALNHPEKVAKLGLICTAPAGAGHPGLAFGAIDAVLHPDITFQWMRSNMDMLFGAPATDPLRDQLAGEALKACRDAYLQQMSNLTVTDMTARLGEIEVPTLIVTGAKDLFFPDADAFAGIADQRVEVFEDSSHMPMFQETAKFAATLKSFAA